MPALLVLGFEPFDRHVVNPSGEVARALHGERLGGCEVFGHVLPVSGRPAAERALALVDQLRPGAVLALGLAARAAVLRVERVAINIDDFGIPGADGEQPRDELIDPDGPDAIFATAPVAEIVAALRSESIPAAVSYHAGTYVCNHVFYRLLLHTRQGPPQQRPLVGFIHVPPLPQDVAAAGADRPCMPLPLTQAGVAVALRVLARRMAAS